MEQKRKNNAVHGIARAALLLLLSLVLLPYLYAQSTTTVTGTSIQDANGNLYANGTVSAFVILNTGQPLPIGVPASGSIGPFPTTGNGAFSVAVASPLTWVFTVCAMPVNLGPTGNPTPTQVCFSSPPIAISGASQDISTTLNAAAKILGPKSGAAGGTPGGSNTQGQVNNNGAFGGTPCQVYPNINTGPVNVGCNWHSIGPNPYVDAVLFGVRAVNPNIAPAVSGINCTTTGGLPGITLSNASTFQNGDGVVCQGAGASNGLGTMSTPTVTPSNARGPTGDFDGVNAPSGATTYNYCVFAVDIGGGATACSSTGSTTTGATTLGENTVTITGATRSNDTWTYTIGSTPPFSAGTLLEVDTPTSGISDADFEGDYNASTVTGTGFTVANAPLDTRNTGARTASTGGYTGHFWNYNKVTWTAPTGTPFRYGVCSDRQTPGTLHLIGMGRLPVNPSDSNMTDGTLEFDDFGQTMEAANTFPWYLSDANCTGAATNDNWVTTIAGGAGTTSLTAAGNAPNSTSAKTIRFDNTPTLLAAVAAAGNAPIELPFDPAGGGYVFNSVMDLSSSNPTLMLPQGLIAKDTILIGGGGQGGGQWYGDVFPGKLSNAQFQSKSVPVITTSGLPGVFVVKGFATYISGLRFQGPDNGITFLQDGGGGNLGSTYYDTQFSTNGSSSDYVGTAFVCRGNALTASCAASFHGKSFIASGSQSMNGHSSTPSAFFDQAANIKFDELMGSARALAVSHTSGFRIGRAEWQGTSTPFIMASNPGTATTTNIQLGDASAVLLDTTAEPEISFLGAATSLLLNTFIYNTNGPSSNFPLVSGSRMANLYVGISGQNRGQNRNICYLTSNVVGSNIVDGVFNAQVPYMLNYCNAAISSGQSQPIFVDGPQVTGVTGTVQAGGAIPLSLVTISVKPVWQNNGEGNSSALIPVSLSTGNQTVQYNWTEPTPKPKGYDLYAAFGGPPGLISTGTCTAPQIPAGTSTFTWSSGTTCPQVDSGIPSGGPAMLLPGGGIAGSKVTINNGQPMSNPPQMTWSGFSFGMATTGSFMALVPDQPITVTSYGFSVPATQTVGLGCSTAPTVRVSDGTTVGSSLTLTNGQSGSSLSGLSLNYPAGDNTLRMEVAIASAGCSTQWGNVFMWVQYKMQ